MTCGIANTGASPVIVGGAVGSGHFMCTSYAVVWLSNDHQHLVHFSAGGFDLLRTDESGRAFVEIEFDARMIFR